MLGGVTTALYGLIGVIGVKIWMDNRVDFADPVNQLRPPPPWSSASPSTPSPPATSSFNGIALGTVAAIVVYHVMSTVDACDAPVPHVNWGYGRSTRPVLG